MTHAIRIPMLLLCVCALLALPAASAQAQEHPEEHPQEQEEHPEEHAEHPEEHAEHPEEHGEAAKITKEDLADVIRDHVESVASDHGGTYPLEDPKSGDTLQLTLVKVHEERLAETAPHTYFACVDFEGRDGTLYDVDFFMKGKSADALEFETFSIHKVDGEPRYTWYEEDGTWKKKHEEMEGEHEHPEEEHPEEEHPDEPPLR